MKKFLFFAIVMVFTAINLPSFAKEDLKIETISAGTLKKMIDDEAAFLLIDARRTEDFKDEHIETAISLPATDVNAKTLTEVAPDIHHKLVFYCQNLKCQASHIAASKAIGAGYKYIYVYSYGIDNWKEKGFPTVTSEEETKE